MADPKILKDITTYTEVDTFKKFRTTLVKEVSENFEIIEEKLKETEATFGEIDKILDEINGEVV